MTDHRKKKKNTPIHCSKFVRRQSKEQGREEILQGRGDFSQGHLQFHAWHDNLISLKWLEFKKVKCINNFVEDLVALLIKSIDALY